MNIAMNLAMPRHIESGHLKTIFHKTLSLGLDLDGRGLHWRLSSAACPEQRLAFAMAVYFTGGSYVLIDPDRGFLCVEKIVQLVFKLKKVRGTDSYRIGHAFAALHEALGYGHGDTAGFSLIDSGDLRNVEGFIKGFGDHVAQSLETDVMRVVRGSAATAGDHLVDDLRHFINDHETLVTVMNDIM